METTRWVPQNIFWWEGGGMGVETLRWDPLSLFLSLQAAVGSRPPLSQYSFILPISYLHPLSFFAFYCHTLKECAFQISSLELPLPVLFMMLKHCNYLFHRRSFAEMGSSMQASLQEHAHGLVFLLVNITISH